MKSHYSGKKSRKFWKGVNKLPDTLQSELYSLGVTLQNIEGEVLKKLKIAKREKKAIRKSKKQKNVNTSKNSPATV